MISSHGWIVSLSGLTILVLVYTLMTLDVSLGPVRDKVERLLTWSQRDRYQRWLNQAGLTRWVAVDVLLLRVVATLTCLLLGAWLTQSFVLTPMMGVGAWFGVWLWLKSRVGQYQQRLSAELPAFLDLLCLCLSSGMNLQTAVALVLDLYEQGGGGTSGQALLKPSGLASYWRRWLSTVCSGNSRIKAFEQLMTELSAPAIRRVCVAMVQAERAGAGMANSLMMQAEQLRQERLMNIERKAMQAPVKMLMPLVICFFPSTFMVLGFSMWLSLTDTLSGLS